MTKLLGKLSVAYGAVTEATRATAGYLTSVIFLDDDDKTWLDRLAEFLSSLGEYFRLVAQNYLPNIPTTPAEIIAFFFGDSLTLLLDQAYERLLRPPHFQGSIFWTLTWVAAFVGFVILVIKALGYLLSIGYNASPLGEYTLEEIVKGRSGLVRPDVYLFERFIPTSIIVGAGPLLVFLGLVMMYRLVADLALAMYGADVTMGQVTYNLMIQIMEESGLVEFVLSFGFFAALYLIFLIVYALEYFFLIVLTIILVIQASRYGDGVHSWEALRKPLGRVVLFAMLVGITWLEIVIGPALFTSAPFDAFPATARMVALLIGVILTVPTVIAVYALTPVIARIPVRSAQKLRRWMAPGYDKYPERNPEAEIAEPLVRPSFRERLAYTAQTLRELDQLYAESRRVARASA